LNKETLKKFLIKIYKNKNIKVLILSSVIFLLVFTVFSAWLNSLNKNIQHFKYKIKNNSNITRHYWRSNPNIVMVKIDDITLEKLWRFPFDREKYIPVIENLTNAWAAVIWLDILFQDKTNEKSDDDFSKAIEKSWKVVIWVSRKNGYEITYPIDTIKKSVLWIGFFAPIVDSINKNVYSIEPFIYAKRYWYIDNFAIKIYKAYYDYLYNKNYIDYKSKINNWKLEIFPWNKILLWENRKNIYDKKINNLLIAHVKTSKFKSKSFYQLYYKDQFDKINNNNYFKDKIVIIWATADGLKDTFFSPLEGEINGVYIHANVLNTILNKYNIKYFDKNIEKLIIFLLIIISVYFNYSVKWRVIFFSNLWIFSLFVIYALVLMLTTPLIPNYLVELILSLLLSTLLTNIDKYGIENKQKWKLNKALSEYVSKDIASEILSWAWKINLDWENKYVTIFFSDIEWFTSVSEKFSPERLVSFLREYLSNMSNIILDKKWFINKYEWDAIMALWWVFWKDNKGCYDDIYSACLSALEQQKRLKELNIIWKEKWFSEIKARIWIHSWDAIIWNIWSEGRKMEFTALWDSVNLASRLEWVNKFYYTYICVSEDVYIQTRKDFEYRFLDNITVKWKNKPIKIYELICLAEDVTDEILSLIKKFWYAIDLYLKKDFKSALSIFEELSKEGDKPSLTYIERCMKYIKTPPVDNWDWVWKMEEK